jgi:hypothetical protein
MNFLVKFNCIGELPFKKNRRLMDVKQRIQFIFYGTIIAEPKCDHCSYSKICGDKFIDVQLTNLLGLLDRIHKEGLNI